VRSRAGQVIIPLYQEYGSDHVGHLDGMFAYVM
jgi:asparagine synthetase B (glutamine-hydrolysing)